MKYCCLVSNSCGVNKLLLNLKLVALNKKFLNVSMSQIYDINRIIIIISITYFSLTVLKSWSFGCAWRRNVAFDLINPTNTIANDIGRRTQYFNAGSNTISGVIILIIYGYDSWDEG